MNNNINNVEDTFSEDSYEDNVVPLFGETDSSKYSDFSDMELNYENLTLYIEEVVRGQDIESISLKVADRIEDILYSISNQSFQKAASEEGNKDGKSILAEWITTENLVALITCKDILRNGGFFDRVIVLLIISYLVSGVVFPLSFETLTLPLQLPIVFNLSRIMFNFTSRLKGHFDVTKERSEIYNEVYNAMESASTISEGLGRYLSGQKEEPVELNLVDIPEERQIELDESEGTYSEEIKLSYEDAKQLFVYFIKEIMSYVEDRDNINKRVDRRGYNKLMESFSNIKNEDQFKILLLDVVNMIEENKFIASKDDILEIFLDIYMELRQYLNLERYDSLKSIFTPLDKTRKRTRKPSDKPEERTESETTSTEVEGGERDESSTGSKPKEGTESETTSTEVEDDKEDESFYFTNKEITDEDLENANKLLAEKEYLKDGDKVTLREIIRAYKYKKKENKNKIFQIHAEPPTKDTAIGYGIHYIAFMFDGEEFNFSIKYNEHTVSQISDILQQQDFAEVLDTETTSTEGKSDTETTSTEGKNDTETTSTEGKNDTETTSTEGKNDTETTSTENKFVIPNNMKIPISIDGNEDEEKFSPKNIPNKYNLEDDLKLLLDSMMSEKSDDGDSFDNKLSKLEKYTLYFSESEATKARDYITYAKDYFESQDVFDSLDFYFDLLIKGEVNPDEDSYEDSDEDSEEGNVTYEEESLEDKIRSSFRVNDGIPLWHYEVVLSSKSMVDSLRATVSSLADNKKDEKIKEAVETFDNTFDEISKEKSAKENAETAKKLFTNFSYLYLVLSDRFDLPKNNKMLDLIKSMGDSYNEYVNKHLFKRQGLFQEGKYTYPKEPFPVLSVVQKEDESTSFEGETPVKKELQTKPLEEETYTEEVSLDTSFIDEEDSVFKSLNEPLKEDLLDLKLIIDDGIPISTLEFQTIARVIKSLIGNRAYKGKFNSLENLSDKIIKYKESSANAMFKLKGDYSEEVKSFRDAVSKGGLAYSISNLIYSFISQDVQNQKEFLLTPSQEKSKVSKEESDRKKQEVKRKKEEERKLKEEQKKRDNLKRMQKEHRGETPDQENVKKETVSTDFSQEKIKIEEESKSFVGARGIEDDLQSYYNIKNLSDLGHYFNFVVNKNTKIENDDKVMVKKKDILDEIYHLAELTGKEPTNSELQTEVGKLFEELKEQFGSYLAKEDLDRKFRDNLIPKHLFDDTVTGKAQEDSDVTFEESNKEQTDSDTSTTFEEEKGLTESEIKEISFMENVILMLDAIGDLEFEEKYRLGELKLFIKNKDLKSEDVSDMIEDENSPFNILYNKLREESSLKSLKEKFGTKKYKSFVDIINSFESNFDSPDLIQLEEPKDVSEETTSQEDFYVNKDFSNYIEVLKRVIKKPDGMKNVKEEDESLVNQISAFIVDLEDSEISYDSDDYRELAEILNSLLTKIRTNNSDIGLYGKTRRYFNRDDLSTIANFKREIESGLPKKEKGRSATKVVTDKRGDFIRENSTNEFKINERELLPKLEKYTSNDFSIIDTDIEDNDVIFNIFTIPDYPYFDLIYDFISKKNMSEDGKKLINSYLKDRREFSNTKNSTISKIKKLKEGDELLSNFGLNRIISMRSQIAKAYKALNQFYRTAISIIEKDFENFSEEVTSKNMRMGKVRQFFSDLSASFDETALNKLNKENILTKEEVTSMTLTYKVPEEVFENVKVETTYQEPGSGFDKMLEEAKKKKELKDAKESGKLTTQEEEVTSSESKEEFLRFEENKKSSTDYGIEIRGELLKQKEFFWHITKESDFLKDLTDFYQKIVKYAEENDFEYTPGRGTGDQGAIKNIFKKVLENATILNKFVLDELKGDMYKKPEKIKSTKKSEFTEEQQLKSANKIREIIDEAASFSRSFYQQLLGDLSLYNQMLILKGNLTEAEKELSKIRGDYEELLDNHLDIFKKYRISSASKIPDLKKEKKTVEVDKKEDLGFTEEEFSKIEDTIPESIKDYMMFVEATSIGKKDKKTHKVQYDSEFKKLVDLFSKYDGVKDLLIKHRSYYNKNRSASKEERKSLARDLYKDMRPKDLNDLTYVILGDVTDENFNKILKGEKVPAEEVFSLTKITNSEIKKLKKNFLDVGSSSFLHNYVYEGNIKADGQKRIKPLKEDVAEFGKEVYKKLNAIKMLAHVVSIYLENFVIAAAKKGLISTALHNFMNIERLIKISDKLFESGFYKESERLDSIVEKIIS